MSNTTTTFATSLALWESPRQWAALALSLVTATIIFFRRVFVLEKVTVLPKRFHLLPFSISLLSGVVFWVSVNAVTSSALVQLLFGILSTTLSWIVLVFLVNERLAYPSRQQCLALVFYALTEVSFLVQVRLVIQDRKGDL